MHNGTHLISDLDAPALAVQSYRVEVVRGPQAGESWEVGEQVRVGKGPENEVVLVDATVSRNHLLLERSPQGFRVRDLGSTNGTFLDNARIVEAFIRPGMELRVGEVLLKLKAVHEGLSIEPSGEPTFGNLVGKSGPMRKIFALLGRVAPTDATILILGETGTGKGAVARAIHDRSPRSGGPLVTVDCGAISRNLIESELFGHEKGSFTGAVALRRGALEMCKGGTLFIDELDDLPLDVQPKLLRALDEREICRVGSNKPIKLELRVVAATKKDLRREVAEGRFREDLYFRLSIVTLVLPPLRERLEDLPLLADRFLTPESGWDRLPRPLRDRLTSYHFPGNVRELRNLLERASYLEGFDALDPTAFPTEMRGPGAPDSEFKLTADYMKPFKDAKDALIERFEREYLKRLMARNDHKVARAAREAQIDRKYLYMLLSKHGLELAGD
ncbi:MAG: sigma 54-dependent Fis family transcriptional regulator [Deltaproteobacteria bacterium]|nr:sigma 54-dependent Fis family transcriptional regulator [Deltaproteobacteria bacterium]